MTPAQIVLAGCQVVLAVSILALVSTLGRCLRVIEAHLGGRPLPEVEPLEGLPPEKTDPAEHRPVQLGPRRRRRFSGMR